MLIDTHCHLDWDSYQEDLSEVLAKAEKAGVEKIVTIGVDEASNAKTRELVRRNEIYRCVGYHPDVVLQDGFDQREINRLMISLEQELLVAKTVGIGECGLDYYTIQREGISPARQEEMKELQRDLFERQVLFAIQNSLPLSLHVRDEGEAAYSDVIEILSEYFGSGQSYDEISYQFSITTIAHTEAHEETAFRLPKGGKINGVLHCVSGSLEYVQAGLSLGFMVSCAGNITFKNVEHLQDIVRAVPLSHIVVETDGPFLTPVPYRGTRNEPSYVVETVKKIAELKNGTVEEVSTATTENAHLLFNF
jgi:TatD DNase family protein